MSELPLALGAAESVARAYGWNADEVTLAGWITQQHKQLAEAQATIAQQAEDLRLIREYTKGLESVNDQFRAERDELQRQLDAARAAHQGSKIDPLGDLSRAAIRQQLEEEEKRLASRPQECE